MNRVLSRASSPPSSINQHKQQKLHSTNLPPYKSIYLILNSFITNKNKIHIKIFWKKCRESANYKKKRNNIMVSLLKTLHQRKIKLYLTTTWNKLLHHRDDQIKKQNQSLENTKNKTKNKSTAIIAIICTRLLSQQIKTVFQTIHTQSKLKYKLDNYKKRYLTRIFNTLTTSKFKLGFDALKKRKIAYLKMKNTLKRLQKLFITKKQYYINETFLKLQSGISPPPKQQITKSPSISTKNSRLKQVISRIPPEPTQQTSNAEKQLQQKNKKIQQQIKIYQHQHQKKIQDFKRQLTQHQAQCQQLKFYIDILDGSIQQLQTQILTRQKRSIKSLSSIQLWDRVYSNFLFLLTINTGQTLPKQKILQYLQYPLPPLNLQLQTIKTENQLLTELLSQYKKIFIDTNIKQINSQYLLPFDILMTKNKFFYSTIEALIRHGVGTEEQNKLLETQLENVIKQS